VNRWVAWISVLGAAIAASGWPGLGASPAAASVVTVLDEDFDDVSWPSVVGRRGRLRAAAGNRTIQTILGTNPWELPWGTTASATDVGVRSSADKINTAKGKSGFDQFFEEGGFAVLGDQKDRIGGAGDQGVFRLDVPFTLDGDVDTIDLSYDFAFDGSSGKASRRSRGTDVPYDLFTVSILSETGDTLLVQQLRSDAFGSGDFHVDGLPMTGGHFVLRFELSEHASRKTNSAVGIDNVLLAAYSGEPSQEPFVIDPVPLPQVTSTIVQVPAPAGAMLLAAGLAVLARRRLRAR
jgi:hypothetical protein